MRSSIPDTTASSSGTADCPDKLCVRQGALDRNGVIVCLPNRVVVRVSTESGADYDAVVGRLESGAGQ